MAYIILIGIALTFLLTIAYILITKKSTEQADGLTWKKSIWFGLQIYLISLFLGSFITSFVENAYWHPIIQIIKDVIVQTFGMLLYAIFFTFILVLPALVIGLKHISKSKLDKSQKEIRFAAVNILSVLIINIIMSGFLSNLEFILFLSGYSFFGIATPWFFVRMKKVFGE